MIPTIRVHFKDETDEAQRLKACEKIQAMKGVLSTAFDRNVKTLVVTFANGHHVEGQITMLKEVSHLTPMR